MSTTTSTSTSEKSSPTGDYKGLIRTGDINLAHGAPLNSEDNEPDSRDQIK